MKAVVGTEDAAAAGKKERARSAVNRAPVEDRAVRVAAAATILLCQPLLLLPLLLLLRPFLRGMLLRVTVTLLLETGRRGKYMAAALGNMIDWQ